MLNALLDPHGLATSVHFQYGTTPSYGLSTAPLNRTGNTFQAVGANVTGLTGNTLYHFRVVASNGTGTTMGSDRTFTTLTPTGPPVVITNGATNITTSSGTLNGSLDPHGLTTTVFFQYGTTTSYGSASPMQTQTGNTYRNVTANVGGLIPHTTYHFRMVATNAGGTRMGSDRTFITQ
jgi:phosphodiesterase/alkaline phosphatase D-like protein